MQLLDVIMVLSHQFSIYWPHNITYSREHHKIWYFTMLELYIYTSLYSTMLSAKFLWNNDVPYAKIFNKWGGFVKLLLCVFRSNFWLLPTNFTITKFWVFYFHCHWKHLMSIPDEGYSRNISCTSNQISDGFFISLMKFYNS